MSFIPELTIYRKERRQRPFSSPHHNGLMSQSTNSRVSMQQSEAVSRRSPIRKTSTHSKTIQEVLPPILTNHHIASQTESLNIELPIDLPNSTTTKQKVSCLPIAWEVCTCSWHNAGNAVMWLALILYCMLKYRLYSGWCSWDPL